MYSRKMIYHHQQFLRQPRLQHQVAQISKILTDQSSFN